MTNFFQPFKKDFIQMTEKSNWVEKGGNFFIGGGLIIILSALLTHSITKIQEEPAHQKDIDKVLISGILANRVYFKDPETNLCFVYVGADVASITCVPCEKVEHMIEDKQ